MVYLTLASLNRLNFPDLDAYRILRRPAGIDSGIASGKIIKGSFVALAVFQGEFSCLSGLSDL